MFVMAKQTRCTESFQKVFENRQLLLQNELGVWKVRSVELVLRDWCFNKGSLGGGHTLKCFC